MDLNLDQVDSMTRVDMLHNENFLQFDTRRKIMMTRLDKVYTILKNLSFLALLVLKDTDEFLDGLSKTKWSHSLFKETWKNFLLLSFLELGVAWTLHIVYKDRGASIKTTLTLWHSLQRSQCNIIIWVFLGKKIFHLRKILTKKELNDSRIYYLGPLITCHVP